MYYASTNVVTPNAELLEPANLSISHQLNSPQKAETTSKFISVFFDEIGKSDVSVVGVGIEKTMTRLMYGHLSFHPSGGDHRRASFYVTESSQIDLSLTASALVVIEVASMSVIDLYMRNVSLVHEIADLRPSLAPQAAEMVLEEVAAARTRRSVLVSN